MVSLRAMRTSCGVPQGSHTRPCGERVGKHFRSSLSLYKGEVEVYRRKKKDKKVRDTGKTDENDNKSDSFAPSEATSNRRMNASTGSAAGGCAVVLLHPWLQPDAPAGACARVDPSLTRRVGALTRRVSEGPVPHLAEPAG